MQPRNKQNEKNDTNTETKVDVGGTYNTNERQLVQLNAVQNGYYEEWRDQRHDQAEDDKTTWQGRREPHGTEKQQTEDNGRHWWRAISCSGWTKTRCEVWMRVYINNSWWQDIEPLPALSLWQIHMTKVATHDTASLTASSCDHRPVSGSTSSCEWNAHVV